MLSSDQKETLRKVYQHVPQFETLLEDNLREELSGLPKASLDKVQVFQGRCLVLQELLAELRHAAGITADRNAKPKL